MSMPTEKQFRKWIAAAKAPFPRPEVSGHCSLDIVQANYVEYLAARERRWQRLHDSPVARWLCAQDPFIQASRAVRGNLSSSFSPTAPAFASGNDSAIESELIRDMLRQQIGVRVGATVVELSLVNRFYDNLQQQRPAKSEWLFHCVNAIYEYSFDNTAAERLVMAARQIETATRELLAAMTEYEAAAKGIEHFELPTLVPLPRLAIKTDWTASIPNLTDMPLRRLGDSRHERLFAFRIWAWTNVHRPEVSQGARVKAIKWLFSVEGMPGASRQRESHLYNDRTLQRQVKKFLKDSQVYGERVEPHWE